MNRMVAALLALLIAIPAAFAQEQKTYSQAELDGMLAPVALYPDPLLSQILMASTYPLEVVEAARWTRSNPGLAGDDAVRAVQGADWDPSVKSLVAFPQVLQRMDENLDWTQSLGDAFLAQQPQLMDTVQQLRQRAQAAGNLQSDNQLTVQQQGQQIYIQPANPQLVYVPYYDPLVVYGTWWWPAYRPVVWAPWPGYVRLARPGVSVSFWWGAPIGVSAGFFFGNCDWGRRSVRVVNANSYYYRPPLVVNRTVVVNRGGWQHDSYHRRGVEYRNVAVRQQFAAPALERQRYQRPPARDLHDSKVLTPQSQPAQQPRMPAARTQQTPSTAQAQLRPRPQDKARPQEQRQEVRQDRREPHQEREHQKGRERS